MTFTNSPSEFLHSLFPLAPTADNKLRVLFVEIAGLLQCYCLFHKPKNVSERFRFETALQKLCSWAGKVVMRVPEKECVSLRSRG